MKISRNYLKGLIKEEFEKSLKGNGPSKTVSVNERWMKMSGLLNEGFGSADVLHRKPSPEEDVEGEQAGEWRADDFQLWLSDTGYGLDISDDPVGLVSKLAENAMHSGKGDAHEFAHQVAELYFRMFEGSH
jgi:hypothetical protein